MYEDKKSDYAPSLLEKLVMWMEIRKKVKQTKTAMRHGKVMIKVYQNQALLLSGDDHKKDRADIQLKIGQLEAKILADQRALNLFNSINLNDPALYEPVKD